MPSPCEVVELPPNDLEALPQIMVDLDAPRRSLPQRVIPAVVGGVFAGLLLVGLGCTPFFKSPARRMAAEQPTIVQANPITGEKSGGAVAASGGNAAPTSAAVLASKPVATKSASPAAAAAKASSGMIAVAATSSKRGGVMSGDAPAQGFSIQCNPPIKGDDASAPRPETAALQGIMTGRNSRAALLDGALYREGDRFGSAVCPWTVAMIDAANVRIEKVFGDRTCGVTIHWQSDKTVASQPRSSQPHASVSATKMR